MNPSLNIEYGKDTLKRTRVYMNSDRILTMAEWPAYRFTVVVTGGRNYAEKDVVESALNILCNTAIAVSPSFKEFMVVQGGARGADNLAYIWSQNHGAKESRIVVLSHTEYANWDKYGKYAGHRRNELMLDKFNPQIVLAFPGGKGTSNMKQLARSRHYDVWEIG